MSYHQHTQKPHLAADIPGLQTSVPERSFTAEMETASLGEGSLPLQAKLDRANRFGHHFSRVGVLSAASIQPKLTMGQPGDQYEQEADQVAAQVMSMPEKQDESVQRSGGFQEPEEEELQMKPLAGSITPLVQRNALMPQEERREEELQMKPQIQRQEMPEEEEGLQMKPQIQRQASRAGAVDAGGLEQSLSSTKGGGSPLPNETRAFMEPRFGADFSGVRIHTDTSATDMNQSIQAQAFTHGKDIYFNSGKFDPGSNSGKSLLAHELTHVVQQTGRA